MDLLLYPADSLEPAGGQNPASTNDTSAVSAHLLFKAGEGSCHTCVLWNLSVNLVKTLWSRNERVTKAARVRDLLRQVFQTQTLIHKQPVTAGSRPWPRVTYLTRGWRKRLQMQIEGQEGCRNLCGSVPREPWYRDKTLDFITCDDCIISRPLSDLLWSKGE